MPTYIVKYSNFKLSKKKEKKIAEDITFTHHKITGANKFFAQVIFEKNKKSSHYMGGKEIKSSEIFLNGQIRSGRSSRIKKQLILKLREIIKKNTKLSTNNIWIYLEDLNPEQMIEYGQILPKSGGEKIWFNKLPENLKIKLKKLDN